MDSPDVASEAHPRLGDLLQYLAFHSPKDLRAVEILVRDAVARVKAQHADRPPPVGVGVSRRHH